MLYAQGREVVTTAATPPQLALPGQLLPTVLFVDDEPDILSGLRIRLRKLRHEYRFCFANSADEAIAVLETEPVDMVVTDMRMPGRTGADLLEEVRFRFPHVIRYVLSGQAEDRLVQRSVAVTHRWLNKPCPHELLAEALSEVVGRWARLDDAVLRRAVATVDALPSHPHVHQRLAAAPAGDGVGVDDLVEMIDGDPAAALKLLQWANSVFADDEPVFDVRRAIELIGVTAVLGLSPANDVFRPFAPTELVPGFGVDLLHRHAGAVADVAGRLVAPDDVELARTGGLLATVGLLVEVDHLADRLEVSSRQARSSDRSLVEVERELFGYAHPDLGGDLLALWGLPRDLSRLVAGSHDRPAPGLSLPLATIDAVRAAGLLVQRSALGRAIGRIHHRPIDDELQAALDRWSTAAGIDVLEPN